VVAGVQAATVLYDHGLAQGASQAIAPIVASVTSSAGTLTPLPPTTKTEL